MPIAMSGPDLDSQDEAHVLEALRSGRLSMGPFTQECDERAARVAGVAHGVATSSGTAGFI
jgi:perosamine synthetase